MMNINCFATILKYIFEILYNHTLFLFHTLFILKNIIKRDIIFFFIFSFSQASSTFIYFISVYLLKSFIKIKKVIRTCVHRIARWIIRWAITLRLILINSAGRIDTATSVLAEIAVAEAHLMWITVASRITRAFKTTYSFSAFSVNTARPS